MSVITKTTDKLWGSPPGTTAIEFNTVGGVPIRADVEHPYNTFGVSVRPRGPVLPTFYNTIEDWVDELHRLAARRMEALVLCSVWRRAKEGDRVNRHAEGQAMDIGGVWWDRRDGITAWDYGRNRREAIGLEATLRMFFGTVLGPTSNKDHANHWHVDTGKKPAITPEELRESRQGIRKVEVVYLQDAMSNVHNIQLNLDGQWGPKTAAAFDVVMAGIDVSVGCNVSEPSVYRAFNLATALVGFGHVEKVG